MKKLLDWARRIVFYFALGAPGRKELTRLYKARK